MQCISGILSNKCIISHINESFQIPMWMSHVVVLWWDVQEMESNLCSFWCNSSAGYSEGNASCFIFMSHSMHPYPWVILLYYGGMCRSEKATYQQFLMQLISGIFSKCVMFHIDESFQIPMWMSHVVVSWGIMGGCAGDGKQLMQFISGLWCWHHGRYYYLPSRPRE